MGINTTDTTGKTKKNKRFRVQKWNIIGVCMSIYDIFAAVFSYFFALWLRFDFEFSSIPETYLNAFLKIAPIYAVVCCIVFTAMRMYKSIWRFVSFNELFRTIAATLITAAFHIVAIHFVIDRMPKTYYFVGIILQFLLVFGIRVAYRFYVFLENLNRNGNGARIMLIGAGSAGQMILRDIISAKEIKDKVCCIIDDDENKWNRYINGVHVIGGRDSILSGCKKYKIEKIYMAIPSATPEDKRDILNICKETGCELRMLPGVYQLVSGNVTTANMQEVTIEDLLGREPIKISMEEVFAFIQGKTILVTGGGGSIGSELCRQIAFHAPKKLIIFDVYENSAYEIQMELKKRYPTLNLVVLIGSVRDSRRISQVFRDHRPEIVFHAAAHKHVPLMEDSPCEAIKDNAMGTYKTAYAAMQYGCKRFVLISTDKAVNPTNIMGASKRLCEMVIQTFDRRIREAKATGGAVRIPALYTHTAEDAGDLDRLPEKIETEFVAVRFGNVLGSNGSVIPLFKKQIAAGGPVTVTHPEIIRYFMTIPEAVSLVLQAGTFARGGEIFVLDMGEPVKIDTLARNLIRLSGHVPDRDIKIVYTGLRPGEKLYEETLMAEEGMKTTPNKLIHIGSPIVFDTDEFLEKLGALMAAAYENDPEIHAKVKEIVSTYTPR